MLFVPHIKKRGATDYLLSSKNEKIVIQEEYECSAFCKYGGMVFALYISESKRIKKRTIILHGSKSLLQTTQAIASPRILFYEKPLHDVPNTVQGDS